MDFYFKILPASCFTLVSRDKILWHLDCGYKH